MTPEELAAMRARVAAATSGPLFVINRGTAHDYDIDAPIASPFHGYTRGMFWRKEDAEFYAAAREDIPALLDEVERLREIERKALEQSEYIQTHGLTEYELARKNAEIALLRARIAALEAVVAAKPTCACARAERLQAEVDGLRVEVDLLTAERNALRQTLLSACACGEATS